MTPRVDLLLQRAVWRTVLEYIEVWLSERGRLKLLVDRW